MCHTFSSVIFFSSPALLLIPFHSLSSTPPNVERSAWQSTRDRCLHSWAMMSCYSSLIILPRSQLHRQWCIKINGSLEDRRLLGHKSMELEVGVEHKICSVRAFYLQNVPQTFWKMKNISMFEIIWNVSSTQGMVTFRKPCRNVTQNVMYLKR